MTTPREDLSETSLGVSTAEERYVNRELSWLSFNEQVLQGAESSSVPLLERINGAVRPCRGRDERMRGNFV